MQTTDPGQASPATLHPDADGESKKRRTEGAVAPVTQHRGALSEEELKIELKVYYDRLFPTSFLFHWLSSMSPVDGLKYREMSFTLPGDIYVRYCSYVTKEALKNDLVSKLPIKIDIGAVYNAPPNMHASIANFAPVHKELVFDIDMTDYDDIRTCCSGAAVCDKCWVLMSAAIRVVHTILTKDFGFEHVLWIFSGRRGIHCWVCDSRARKLGHDAREAIINFLSCYQGKEKKINVSMNQYGHMHPSMQRAYEQLLPYFEDLLESQGWMDTPEACDKILEFIDPSLRDEFRPSNDDDAGLQKWFELKNRVKSFLFRQKKFTAATNSVRSCLQRIVFYHAYPRLDVNVSKHLNHLLKSPFCVHPKTGKVCVPIDPKEADGFDCNAVPHILQLHDELNAFRSTDGSSKATWSSTSLKPSIELFRQFVTKLMNAARVENPRSYAKHIAAKAQQDVATNEW